MEVRKQIFCYPEKWNRLLQFSCRLAAVGYLPDQLHWNKNRTLHGLFFCITLNREGRGQSLVNGQPSKSIFTPPCLHIHVPGTVLHTIKAVKHDEIFFCYTGENALCMQNMGFENCHFEITPEISDLIMRLKKELLLPDSPVKADNLDLLALQLLVAIRASGEMLSEKFREDGTRFQELISFLDLHFQEDLPLEKLLARFGFSRRTFFRIWKKKFSCTFTEYLNGLKLSHAANLLTSTTLSIADIAQNCSFASSTYFIRRFKKQYGVTPVSYRKLKQKTSKLQ